MTRVLTCLTGALFLMTVSCAGKKTVSESWDSSPKACSAPLTSRCTPLPQEIPGNCRVEAALRGYQDTRIQYYALIKPEPRALVLFIHGALGHASDFRRQFSRAVDKVSLIAYDRPGFVRSGPEKEFTLAYQSEAVSAFFPDAGKLPIVLVGHSYGGAVALAAALRFPDRVKGLVLTGAILDPDRAAAYWAQQLLNLPAVSGVLPNDLRNTNREVIHLKADLQTVERRLPGLAIPVEAIHGGKDPVVDPANLFYLQRQLEAAGHASLLEMKLYTDYGHFIPDQNPEALNAAIERVLERMHVK